MNINTDHGDIKRTNTDMLDDIIAYENGDLDGESTIRFFGRLVETNLAWALQGHYGRTAMRLIDAGMIDSDGVVNEERVEELR